MLTYSISFTIYPFAFRYSNIIVDLWTFDTSILSTVFSTMKLIYLGIGAALVSQVIGGEDTVDINTPFKVASGSQKGSCDDHKDILNHMLQQTTDMAQSGADAVG